MIGRPLQMFGGGGNVRLGTHLLERGFLVLSADLRCRQCESELVDVLECGWGGGVYGLVPV